MIKQVLWWNHLKNLLFKVKRYQKSEFYDLEYNLTKLKKFSSKRWFEFLNSRFQNNVDKKDLESIFKQYQRFQC